MTEPVKKTDLQFDGADVTAQKLRRLVQDLQAVESAVNALITSVASLTTTVNTPASKEVLATTTTLGPAFEVDGLTAGMVLKAISATNAAFAKLRLTDLADFTESMPTNGQVATYMDGTWTNANLPTPGAPTSGMNLGSGASVYAGIESGSLAFRTLMGDGATVAVALSPDNTELVISSLIVAGGDTPLTWLDM
jgi:hypothetical protein